MGACPATSETEAVIGCARRIELAWKCLESSEYFHVPNVGSGTSLVCYKQIVLNFSLLQSFVLCRSHSFVLFRISNVFEDAGKLQFSF